ncbi:MAG: TRAP transporter large permease subunit [Chloroflexi bacterium]|nr:TRAP transporter large permease subunit [Chloroflexota bacterium]
MSHTAIIYLVIIAFAVLLVFGQSIPAVMALAAMLGIGLWLGYEPLRSLLQFQPFASVSHFPMVIIPLYVLMAEYVFRSGMVQDMFTVIYLLTGRRANMLGMAVLWAGGVIGAASASADAMAAAFAETTVDDLEKYGYKREFTAAIAAAAGTFSLMIPPSLIMILYAVLIEASIGQIFLGAMIPGAMFVVAGSIVFLILAKREGIGKTTHGQVALATKSIRPALPGAIVVLIIIVIIFGGIYGGVVTATEAGALASSTALIGSLVIRRLSWQSFSHSFSAAVKLTSVIFLLILFGVLLGRFVSLSGLPRQMVSLMGPLASNPVVLMGVLLIIYFILGMFITPLPIMLITLPVVTPMIEAANIQPIWAGVLITEMLAIAQLTPPVGMCVYVTSAITKVPLESVFRYSIWFAITEAALVFPFVLFFPQLATWLPSLVKGV